jgi:hypothetical protein
MFQSGDRIVYKIAVALLAMVSLAPAPAPSPPSAPGYILRFEETGVSRLTPVAADAEPSAPTNPDPDPDEKLISLTEVPVVHGRELRLKMQVVDAARVLNFTSQPDPSVPDQVRVRIEFQTDYKDEVGLKATSSIKTDISLKPGQRYRLGGIKNHGTVQKPEGQVLRYRSYNTWATLVKAE